MENNALEMGLFGGETELELNFGDTPVNGGPDTTPEVIPASEDTPAEASLLTGDVQDTINPNEDVSPESVVGDDQVEGGADDVTSPNLFSSFASELHKEGILPSFDQDTSEIKDTGSLAGVIKTEIDAQVKQYLLNKVGEKGYEALESGVSLAQYEQHQTTVSNLETITEDALKGDLDLAKRVIMQDYINQGLTEASAKRILQKTVDLGEEAVLEDSLESIGSLKLYEAKRMEQAQIQAVADEKARVKHATKIDNDLKNAIYTEKEFIPGIKGNKAMQDQVYNSITKIVGESPEGVMENQLMQDRRENPVDFDAKLYYLYEMTKGFNDFSKLTKNAESKAVTDFEKVLRMTKFEGSTNPTYVDDNQSYDSNLGSELVFN